MKFFVITFFIFIISCQTTKKVPIPFWEENSYGSFEINYFQGDISSTAKGLVYFKGDEFLLKILGPLNITVLSMEVKGNVIKINYGNQEFIIDYCSYINIESLKLFFNGDKNAFPSNFNCSNWNISYDGEGGSIKGISSGGDIFFVYITTDKPFQKFSIEYLRGDLSINGKLKGIWLLP